MSPKELSEYLNKFPKDFLLYLILKQEIIYYQRPGKTKEHIDYHYLLYKHEIANKKALIALNKPGMSNFDDYLKYSAEEEKLWKQIEEYHNNWKGAAS